MRHGHGQYGSECDVQQEMEVLVKELFSEGPGHECDEQWVVRWGARWAENAMGPPLELGQGEEHGWVLTPRSRTMGARRVLELARELCFWYEHL